MSSSREITPPTTSSSTITTTATTNAEGLSYEELSGALQDYLRHVRSLHANATRLAAEERRRWRQARREYLHYRRFYQPAAGGSTRGSGRNSNEKGLRDGGGGDGSDVFSAPSLTRDALWLVFELLVVLLCFYALWRSLSRFVGAVWLRLRLWKQYRELQRECRRQRRRQQQRRKSPPTQQQQRYERGEEPKQQRDGKKWLSEECSDGQEDEERDRCAESTEQVHAAHTATHENCERPSSSPSSVTNSNSSNNNNNSSGSIPTSNSIDASLTPSKANGDQQDLHHHHQQQQQLQRLQRYRGNVGKAKLQHSDTSETDTNDDDDTDDNNNDDDDDEREAEEELRALRRQDYAVAAAEVCAALCLWGLLCCADGVALSLILRGLPALAFGGLGAAARALGVVDFVARFTGSSLSSAPSSAAAGNRAGDGSSSFSSALFSFIRGFVVPKQQQQQQQQPPQPQSSRGTVPQPPAAGARSWDGVHYTTPEGRIAYAVLRAYAIALCGAPVLAAIGYLLTDAVARVQSHVDGADAAATYMAARHYSNVASPLYRAPAAGSAQSEGGGGGTHFSAFPSLSSPPSPSSCLTVTASSHAPPRLLQEGGSNSSSGGGGSSDGDGVGARNGSCGENNNISSAESGAAAAARETAAAVARALSLSRSQRERRKEEKEAAEDALGGKDDTDDIKMKNNNNNSNGNSDDSAAATTTTGQATTAAAYGCE